MNTIDIMINGKPCTILQSDMTDTLLSDGRLEKTEHGKYIFAPDSTFTTSEVRMLLWSSV